MVSAFVVYWYITYLQLECKKQVGVKDATIMNNYPNKDVKMKTNKDE